MLNIIKTVAVIPIYNTVLFVAAAAGVATATAVDAGAVDVDVVGAGAHTGVKEGCGGSTGKQ